MSKYILNREELKDINEGILNNLANKIKNNISRSLGGDIGKIDTVVAKYKADMESIYKEESAAISKLKGVKDASIKQRISSIIEVLNKKKVQVKKTLDTTIAPLIKDSERKIAYYQLQQNEVETVLLDTQLSTLSNLNVEGEYVNGLVTSYNSKKEESAKEAKKAAEKSAALEKEANAKAKAEEDKPKEDKPKEDKPKPKEEAPKEAKPKETKETKEPKEAEYTTKDGKKLVRMVVKVEENGDVVVLNKKGEEIKINKSQISKLR